MLLFDGLLGIVVFGLWIFCVIDVVTTPRGGTRNLPKLAWLVIVIVFAAIGSIAWLLFGRPWRQPGVLVGAGRPNKLRASSPDDDEDFLAALDARVQEQRRAREREDRPEDPAA